MLRTHSTYMNYMDDDTVEVGCHYCKWESTGHEDEDEAQSVIDEHIRETDDYAWTDPVLDREQEQMPR